jgi:hypothetical protein
MVRITLADALASGDLESCIRQEEAEGKFCPRQRQLLILLPSVRPR